MQQFYRLSRRHRRKFAYTPVLAKPTLQLYLGLVITFIIFRFNKHGNEIRETVANDTWKFIHERQERK